MSNIPTTAYYAEIVTQLDLSTNKIFQLNIDHFTEEEGSGRDELVLQYFGKTGFDDLVQRIVESFEDTDPSSLIDLGSGSGTFLLPVVNSLNPEIFVAFDATEFMLDLVKQKHETWKLETKLGTNKKRNFYPVIGDMEQIERSLVVNRQYLPDLPRSYAMVLSTLAIHHIPDTEEVLRGMTTIMKPDGKGIIIDAILSETSHMEDSPEHAHRGFVPDDLVALARKYFGHVRIHELAIKCKESASRDGTDLFMLELKEPIHHQDN